MNTTSVFIIYLTAFRLAIIAAGIISIVLGYRLFCKGIWPDTGSGKGTDVDTEIGGWKFKLQNAAPGTCFAMFGVLIISVMFATGGPQMTVEEGPGKESSIILRGEIDTDIDTDILNDIVEKGDHYYKQGDTDRAIAEYQKALNIMAAPMNHLAWIYQGQGRGDEALPLSRLAVQFSPNNANFLHTLAEILFEAREYAEALRLMEKAVRLDDGYREKLERFREAVK